MGLSDVGDDLEGLDQATPFPGRVYVASSWRNIMHTGVCAALKAAKIDHYDFKNPEPGVSGFHWGEVGMASYRRGNNNPVPMNEYLRGLEHMLAVEGFEHDFAAMEECDTFVLVLPAGRSSHLELGWAVGRRKNTAVLLEDPIKPDLMYLLADYLAPSLFDLLGWLGVKD